ncbi:hypothetical protein GFL89_14070 [Rhizobium leguminosarum bv. viciae]|nr:hypothetical protein [Rhizobium leguminosarum bv. viciae]
MSKGEWSRETFCYGDRHSDPHRSSVLFSRHPKHARATLISSGSGVGHNRPTRRQTHGQAISVFRFSRIEELFAGTRCRHFRHFRRPDKLAGRRRMPLDLNFPEGVQTFDMAFAERVSMVLIPSGHVLNRA